MKDLFEDVRAVAEPSGALALAGMKIYRPAQHSRRTAGAYSFRCQRELPRPALRLGTLRTGRTA
ncbi:hypothetical protein ACVXHA_12170 [Escherichia coli]